MDIHPHPQYQNVIFRAKPKGQLKNPKVVGSQNEKLSHFPTQMQQPHINYTILHGPTTFFFLYASYEPLNYLSPLFFLPIKSIFVIFSQFNSTFYILYKFWSVFHLIWRRGQPIFISSSFYWNFVALVWYDQYFYKYYLYLINLSYWYDSICTFTH